jgi:hypothetical protein
MGLRQSRGGKSLVDQLFGVVGVWPGQDLTGKIIVDATIFRNLTMSIPEELLRKAFLDSPIRPTSNDLTVVSEWCRFYFELISQVDPGLNTQQKFGAQVGLSQSDISSLLSARKNFYFGPERIEKLFIALVQICKRATAMQVTKKG